MKCIEKIVVHFRSSTYTFDQDILKFAYRHHGSVEDACLLLADKFFKFLKTRKAYSQKKEDGEGGEEREGEEGGGEEQEKSDMWRSMKKMMKKTMMESSTNPTIY